MSSTYKCMSLVCAAWLCGQLTACGDAPGAAGLDAIDKTTQTQPSLRKPPTLASTIYDVDCETDADCTLVPQGDVCVCAGFGAMRLDNEDKFLQRRQRLGARCPAGAAPVCRADSALHTARCQSHQCVADAPRALSCIDESLPVTWPVSVKLSEGSSKVQDAALSMCPGSVAAPEGASQVFLWHPKAAGKYRFVLSDAPSEVARPVWLIVRTPDCQSNNVACRYCADASERCLVDEVLGPDDTAVVVVRNCDGDCTLQVGQWDPATPLVPPL